MTRAYAAILLLILTVVPVYSESTLPPQEKCAEGAKAYAGDDDNMLYAAHYNKKLDKCFVYISRASENASAVWFGLKDLFGNKPIGFCSFNVIDEKVHEKPSLCYVDNVDCNSLTEFENLVRPYMEE
jgi:hypothetical protein